MSNIICVTNRKLVTEKFSLRIERIAAARPNCIILREKDLPLQEYKQLARNILAICERYNVPLMLNKYAELGTEFNLPVQIDFQTAISITTDLSQFGVSVHSVKEVQAVSCKGAMQIIAGHIWETDCKSGLPGRGVSFLQNVVRAAGKIPVYAIGGVTPERMKTVRECGASGACIMSKLMTCPDPALYI